MTEKLMEDDPPIVRWILAFLEDFSFGGVQEWGELGSIAFCAHSVRDDYVFEPALVTNIIVLSQRSIQGTPKL